MKTKRKNHLKYKGGAVKQTRKANGNVQFKECIKNYKLKDTDESRRVELDKLTISKIIDLIYKKTNQKPHSGPNKEQLIRLLICLEDTTQPPVINKITNYTTNVIDKTTDYATDIVDNITNFKPTEVGENGFIQKPEDCTKDKCEKGSRCNVKTKQCYKLSSYKVNYDNREIELLIDGGRNKLIDKEFLQMNAKRIFELKNKTDVDKSKMTVQNLKDMTIDLKNQIKNQDSNNLVNLPKYYYGTLFDEYVMMWIMM